MFPIPSRKDLPGSMTELQDEINHLFQRFWHAGLSTGPLDGMEWAPPLDMIEEPDRFVLRAEVPGLDVADIQVNYADGSVTLRGNKRQDYAADAGGVIRRERRFGQFARTVSLPCAVEADQIKASCRNGVLEVIVPKKAEAQSRTVRIDVSE